ncbi:sugar ABC transporter substrate-binding protein [Roseomonas sp. OT10]|uniref:ABC transporter substrate-binding protein n=1 Tax=Roseomonas cutis TaxID=2897332 RepID=UPI001E40A606|nr:sugar ABC transporter substrate-binding protein [Roseomonas sp. OT10]UFN49278.1 sugar ABC transporter substrate-binding protein [Roseomonas sp. OT10]
MPSGPASSLTRRTLLQAAGAAALAGQAAAQAPITLRVMTLQRAPGQLKAYEAMVQGFEAANPGIKVSILPVSQTDLWPKLAAAYAGGDVPDLVLQLTSENAVSLYGQGLILPVDDVVKAVGEEDFEPAARNLFKDKGSYFAVPASNNCVSLLWYRTDLLQEAGLSPPRTWAELVNVARKLTKGEVYGASLPYGKTAMTNSITWTLIYQAGGRVIAPDGSVTFNSDATVAALEFLKEMHPFCPPGANRYDFFDVLNAYVTGQAASCMYTGRAIGNVNAENPKLADSISVVPFPLQSADRPWWSGAFECIVIPKAAKNVEAAKKFAAWNFRKDTYIDFINATPGHQIPMLRSVSSSPEYLGHPLLVKYRKELDTSIDTLARAHATCKPTDDYPLIARAGEIQNSGIFAETIQRVVIEGMPPKRAAAMGQDRLARLLR